MTTVPSYVFAPPDNWGELFGTQQALALSVGLQLWLDEWLQSSRFVSVPTHWRSSNTYPDWPFP